MKAEWSRAPAISSREQGDVSSSLCPAKIPFSDEIFLNNSRVASSLDGPLFLIHKSPNFLSPSQKIDPKPSRAWAFLRILSPIPKKMDRPGPSSLGSDPTLLYTASLNSGIWI